MPAPIFGSDYLEVDPTDLAPKAPVLTAISPYSTPANANMTLAVRGRGFDRGVVVMVGPTSISPVGAPTSTDATVQVPAANISIAGAVNITVKNSDGQVSNILSLTLT